MSPCLDTIRQKRDQAPKQHQETNPKSYAETIKGDKKIFKEDYMDTPPPRVHDFSLLALIPPL